jgi:hypothetical protein
MPPNIATIFFAWFGIGLGIKDIELKTNDWPGASVEPFPQPVGGRARP